MPANIKDILDNVKQIFMTDSSLVTLLDYERVLDELDLYSFDHWKLGELIEGPIYDKYFVTCRWMFPYRKMPNPAAMERLLNYGCEVEYEEDELEYPIQVKGPEDFKPGTRVPRLVKKPVWIVSVTIPKKLMNDIERGSIELENESIDLDDIETAYEEGEDKEATPEQPAAPTPPTPNVPGPTPPTPPTI